MIEEIWKDVIGFEGMYEVSNFGNVKSLKRNKKIILKSKLDKDGYCEVVLYKNTNRKYYRIHRLVCEAFLDNPEKKKQVNHKNGIRNDNILENLEYMTASENIIHKFKVLGFKSSNETRKKLSENTKGINNPRFDNNIYTFFNKELNIIEICTRYYLYEKYKLHKGNITNLIKGKHKSVKNWIVIKNPENI